MSANVSVVLSIDLGAFFALACQQVLAHLPIHGCLQRIFHGQRSAIYEEQIWHVFRARHASKGFHKFGHIGRIDVGVRRLIEGNVVDALQKPGLMQFRMVVRDGLAGEEGVEIEILAPGLGISQVRAVRTQQVDRSSASHRTWQ